ncbi:zinc finger protein 91-like [Rhopalosiphum maidis]|uniref:zinc finger protein 91-like n=1 Tax=Rhopalosiphum maidis TaxID=43146 RepID=UPI000EFDC4D8|nr:zinc finger protein 91-like [Rhopalosiphum maidis]XP_026817494.1 zinc finger protein 91-like [Rhopalosiphum maidis]
MTPMKDYIKVEVTGDADAVTSELYVENTIENPAWYTVEDNHVSLISENVEKVIKVETDMLDDCMWESRIEISKDVANQNNVELSLETQNIPVDNIEMNPESTSHKIFYCNICGKSFALNYLLKNHTKEHKRQVHFKINKCKYCGERFKLKFGLNRHIQKYHNHMYECKFCKLIFEKSMYNEHMKSHEKNEARIDTIPNIKLRKLNGVWKSKTNVFKCNICFQKCHSEKNLVEHMETHNNFQTQCNDCLKYISVSELNNHMQQIHNKHLFKCQKCNLQFEKQQHLNCHLIHCLKSSSTKWNKVRGKCKVNSTTCSACGIVFNNSLSLKNHMTIGCKHYTCKYCGQFFSSRILWLRHMDVHEKDEQCVMLTVNTDKTTTIKEYDQTKVVNGSSCNTNEGQLLSRNVIGKNSSDQTNLVISNDHIAPHLMVNNINLNINKEKRSCKKEAVNSNESITLNISQNLMIDENNTNLKQNKILVNIKKRNGSGQIDLMNSNATIVSTASNNSMANDCHIKNIKQERCFNANAKDKNISHQMINNQPTVSAVPHNSIANNCLVLNIKQEKDLCTTTEETNSSDQINSVNSNESISTVSHTSISNNVLNIKQEKHMSTNDRGRTSSDNIDLVNSNDSMAYQNPINIANSHIASTIRETPYFCIRKLPNIKSVFYNDNNEQTSQNDVIFICRICRKSPATDIHSFALHMSDHSECNMHECIVCDKTFTTVLLWTNHMTYHQQQLDLNVSAVQYNLIGTDPNTLAGPINSGNTEPQVCTTSRNRKFKTSSSNDSYLDIISLNNSANKIKNQYDCSTCKKVFPSKVTLKVHHQTNHNKAQSFFCRYCDRIFSGRGQCTNHEKSHIGLNELVLQNNEDNNPESIVNQNNISIENNNIDSETRSIKHKNKIKLSTRKNYCNLCRRKFTKRCYFTNHMQLKHNIKTNSTKQLTSIDCRKPIVLSKNIELTNKYKNKLSVPVDRDLNNQNEKKSTFCTICNKNFAHLGALTNHMNIHSDHKLYKCQYCSRKFRREGPYIMHEKKHVLNNEIKSAPNQNRNNITVEVNENCNDFHLVHNPVDGNSNGTNFINSKHLWFTCDVCEKKFSTPFLLNIHRKSHPDVVPYICKICNRSYSLKFRWNWHLKEHYVRHYSKQHTNNLKSNIGKQKIGSIHHQDKMKCRYCKKEYNSISQWKKHMTMSKECRRHCKSNLPEFTSNQASKKSTKSCRFKCNICQKTYSTSYNRSVHIKNVHNKLDTTVLNIHNNTSFQKEKPIEIIQQKPVIKKGNRSNYINSTKCKLCGKVYSSAANLGRHVSIIHTNSYKPMTCNVCGKTFKHKFSYREHLKTKHKKLFKNYEEINCKNKRTNRKVIPMNKKGITKYFCKICKIKFADNITLQEHSKMHVVNMYKCKDCGQQFETNVTLGNHILENHSANISTFNKNKHVENYESQNASQKVINNNPAQCKVCLKILKDPGYLHEHMRLHTGVKPFKCDNCNKAFRFKSNLRMHQKKNLPCYIP